MINASWNEECEKYQKAINDHSGQGLGFKSLWKDGAHTVPNIVQGSGLRLTQREDSHLLNH